MYAQKREMEGDFDGLATLTSGDEIFISYT